MAHNIPDGDKDRQKEGTLIKEEQHENEEANIVESVSRLSVSCCQDTKMGIEGISQESGDTSYSDETSVKSCLQNTVLNRAHLSSQGVLGNCTSVRTYNEGYDYDRRQAQPTSAAVFQSRLTAAYHLPYEQGQDISLNTRQSVAQVNLGSGTSASTLQDLRQTISPLSIIAATSAERAAQKVPLNMNILPLLHEPRVNNTTIQTALAEQQSSFRTTHTVLSDLSPINRDVNVQHLQQQENYGHVLHGTYHSNCISGIGVHTPLRSMHPSVPYVSVEDNCQNISMSPYLGYPPMTAQPIDRNLPTWQQNNGYGNYRSQAGGSGQQSYTSSNSSHRSFINSDCLVKKLSWKILSHVALTLQCRYVSASWKDLVERYGWDYNRTYLFENKDHQNGIFFSLLLEPEFQDYSLEKLRKDLFELPRRDLLNDLNQMIIEHNAAANGNAASQNQLN